MRVAFIVGTFPALSETFILNQITGLLDLGVEVDIFASSKGNYPKVHPDVGRYNLLSRTFYLYSNMPANKPWRAIKAMELFILNSINHPTTILNSLNIFKHRRATKLFYLALPFLNGKDYDIVHAHFGPNGNLGILLKEIGVVKGRLITASYGYDVNKYEVIADKNVYKNLFSKGDLFIANTKFIKQRMLELGCDEKKIVVLPLRLRIEKFKFSERKIQSGEPVKILTIARLVEEKGHEYSIKALAKVLAKHKNLLYIIAGDGPLRGKLESLVSKLEINDYVQFLGAVEENEALKLYQQAHIFVLPSATSADGGREGGPLVLQEAQAVGLPVISTLLGGIPEGVLDGKSGFLVPERDSDALAERIEYLIEHPEIWPEMGKCGRRFVEERYDSQKLNQQLVKIYEALLTNNDTMLEELRKN